MSRMTTLMADGGKMVVAEQGIYGGIIGGSLLKHDHKASNGISAPPRQYLDLVEYGQTLDPVQSSKPGAAIILKASQKSGIKSRFRGRDEK